jgi:hypothetical protein
MVKWSDVKPTKFYLTKFPKFWVWVLWMIMWPRQSRMPDRLTKTLTKSPTYFALARERKREYDKTGVEWGFKNLKGTITLANAAHHGT